MIISLIFLAASLLISDSSGDDPKGKQMFISPVKIPLALSANFGELRIDHFHSGIDIKTQGVSGKEVVASAEGYIYRISVSPGGFGKALYMKHSSGFSTVYGHLDRFAPEIEDYVISRQYENKSFMITLWPQKDRFRFRQGDLIAYAGNSGSSSGPHLHYEIRKTDEEIPLNPLIYGFGIEDKSKPVFETLYIYPAEGKTLINARNKVLKVTISGGNGKYYLPADNKVDISGAAGFGFRAYDLISNTPNKFSVYSIELRIDSMTLFSYRMDKFPFSESRYINSHIDYETFQRDNIYVERTYVLPNDKLSIYQNVVNRGIYNFNDTRKHKVEIIVSDIHGNKSKLSFSVISGKQPGNGSITENTYENEVVMPYNRNNRFISKNVAVHIPSGTLYDTLYFEFKRYPGSEGGYSEIFKIHNIYTPVHKPYNLRIKPDFIPEGMESKMLIVFLTEDIKKVPLPSEWDNGYLSADPQNFGAFTVDIDTIPPRIVLNGNSEGADLRGKTNLKVRITDDLAGIKSYEPLIDGNWALFEYDQKNNLLIYNFDKARLEKGMKHLLYLKVTDNKDNVSSLNYQFFW